MEVGFPRPPRLTVTIAVMALVLAVKFSELVSIAAAHGAEAGDGGGASEAAPGSDAAPAAPQAAPAPAAVQERHAAVAPAAPPTQAARDAVPVSDEEKALLLDLRKRREVLEARAHELDQRDGVMAAAEKKLAARVEELAALQTRLETLEAARQQHDAQNWAGLVHVYENMKPRDAAVIFDALDMQVLLGVLDRMNERKAAPILAAMEPDRARLATQMLAEMRTRSVTPPGEKPPVRTEPKG
jgi:flagellar motility protein MotE (MotC chaperone)